MARNTKEIELFGFKLNLSERNAQDVLDLAEYVKASEDSNINLYSAGYTIESGLRSNYADIRFYDFKKKKLKKLLSTKNILKSLSTKEIFDIALEVYKLEGYKVDDTEALDSKKKVAE